MSNDIKKLLIPEENLEKLRCTRCKQYLSNFPIYLCPGAGNYCGRCSPPEDKTPVRNHVYEDLAEVILFPCRYTQYGCTEIQTPPNLCDHEDICFYRQYDCATISKENCPWKGRLDELLGHFQAEHSELIIKEKGLRLDLQKEFDEKYLFAYRDKLFVVHLVFSFGDNLIKFSVCMLGLKNDCKDYGYQVDFKNENSEKSILLSDLQKITYFETKGDFYVNSLDISQIVNPILYIYIKYNSESFQNVERTVKSIQTSHPFEDLNQTIFESLTYDICCRYLIAPIYACHNVCNCSNYFRSVCKNCSKEYRYCSVCESKVKIRSVRNFALESIIEKLTFYCKNREFDCPFYSDNLNLQAHENECTFNPIDCPLWFCRWKLKNLDNFMEHMEEEHPENILRFGKLSIRAKDEYNDCFVVESLKRRFLVTIISVKEENCVIWKAVPLGSEDDESGFSCVVDLLDTKSNGCKRLVIKMPCKSDFCKISSDIIRDMVGKELVCRLRICK